MSENRGRFIWYELLTKDVDAARAFYQDLVGWGHMAWDGPMDYHMFTQGDMPIAGMVELPEEAQEAGAPSHWMGYVHVDDRDAALARALDLGASKMVEMDVPTVGKFAVIQDPQGAMVALYTPENDPGPEAAEFENGRVCWHELATADYDAAWSFYSEMFGWEVIDDMDMGEMGTYRIFGRNGKQMGGMFTRPPEMPVSSWLYYVQVPSCAEAAESMGASGGKVVNGPMEVPGGNHIVQAVDPTGAMFALHSLGEQQAEA